MFLWSVRNAFCLLPALVSAATVTYTLPSTAPTGATALDPAPVGVSWVLTDSGFLEIPNM